MKVALCFIISYDHILNKEEIWRKWIGPNKDIINVYFYYKDLKKIKSQWILEHIIPEKYIFKTSYYHVIPAYISSMNYAFTHDSQNKWFCMLSESCCPIITPKMFRYLFFENYNNSIMSWRKAWWNIQFHKRANLAKFPKELHLANDPWFVLKRENVEHCINFIKVSPKLTNTICDGGLANESLFAIILYMCEQLNTNNIISSVTHITDWSRMESPTSPHLFKYGDEIDIKFIDSSLETNKYAMFIRKISPEFPDDIIVEYVFNKDDTDLVIKEPWIVIYNKHKKMIFYFILPVIVMVLIFNIYFF